MLHDDSSRKTLSPYEGSNPFADAILSFIDEIKDNEDRKSIFYKEVVQVACHLAIAEDGTADHNLISATGLSKFISDLELQHRKKSGVRRVFSWAQPLVEGLTQYTAALDVMIQADPTGAALIYGGARLVLQLANGYTKYFEQIAQMMADIGVQLQYFHIYTREFATDKYMSETLCNSYRDILLFWRDASKILNQRGKRFLAGGLLVPFNERYAKFKQKLDRNAQNVRDMAQALHIKTQGTFNRTQTTQVRDIAVALERIESPRPPDYSDSDTATRHDEVRRWISGGRVSRIDPRCDLDRHLSSRHAGTCEWIFDDAKYATWQSSGESACLWMNASPGSGKSVLAATVIDKLANSEKKDLGKVIYFFCRFDEPEKCKSISALRSLAIQALKLVKYIPDDLYDLYQEEFSAEDAFVANTSIAEQVLGCLLKHIPYVSIIVDGLDECRDGALIDSLIRLREQKGPGITKWLLTSRNDPIARKRFETSKWEILTVSYKVIQNDIRKFLEDNIDLLCAACNQLDQVTKLSQGNFLMMRLTIDPFRNEELTCSEEFDKVLASFQPELGRCWFRSLQRLLERSEQIQELAQMIFNAVLLAAQPMTFNELLDLLSVKIGEEPSSGRRRTRSVVLSACSPFVEVDYDSDFVNPTLRLVHKSIGELLSRDPKTIDFVTKDCYKFFVNFKKGNEDIGRRCLTYLSYKRYQDFRNVDLDDDNTNGLLKYASVFWHKHLQDAGGSQELFEVVRKFMKSPNFWTCVRVQSKFAPHTFAKLSYNSKTDYYRMHLSSTRPAPESSNEEYYADALPPWLGEYDSQGDVLVWAYHMIVREFGEVLVRYPDEIQQYFAKILGSRGFWYTKGSGKERTEVKTVQGSTTLQELLEPYQVDELSTAQSQTQDTDDKAAIKGTEKMKSYIQGILKENRGDWKLDHVHTVKQSERNATIHRYKLVSMPVSDDEEDGSGDESSDDEKPKPAPPEMADEPAIWFLSVTTNDKEEPHFYHHITKVGVLQKSVPLFLTESPYLLWPQEENYVAIINLNTRKWSLTDLPKSDKTDRLLLSQEYRELPSTGHLCRSSIYCSAATTFTIRHTAFTISHTNSSEPPQITSSNLVSQETTWRYPNRTLDLPASFTWCGTTLYAALGSPAVRILRFPSQSESLIQSPIRVLKRRLYIPCSSYARGLCFLIHADAGSSSSQAIFVLEAAPKFDLPAVLFDFRLDSEDWEDYDPDKIEDHELLISSARFLKGAYASKDQAFSVPIRSGLDWRRSVYVTCW